MSRRTDVKRSLIKVLWRIRADSLFRNINRRRCLVLAYHGVTKKRYAVQPYTLLEEALFKSQIKYLSSNYNIVSLKTIAECIRKDKDFPEKSAVITFDDGYRNNYSIAFPILQKYHVPATIFLTAGYIGTLEMLTLDEVYEILLGCQSYKNIDARELGLGVLPAGNPADIEGSCWKVINHLKRMTSAGQKETVRKLRERVNPERNKGLRKDFELLSWDEAKSLKRSGLIDFGAHTVSHQILAGVDLGKAEEEVVNSKRIIEDRLKIAVESFAYPNGTRADFTEEHMRMLSDNDFTCAVTTIAESNKREVNPYEIGRISVGANEASSPAHFALRASGALECLKDLGRMFRAGN
jgi:peptidoglycan/xylan/chitin deacetylase (PgdA/CDA1 family)